MCSHRTCLFTSPKATRKTKSNSIFPSRKAEDKLAEKVSFVNKKVWKKIVWGFFPKFMISVTFYILIKQAFQYKFLFTNKQEVLFKNPNH